MARYKKSEIEDLSEVDALTLLNFQKLLPSRQWAIIDTIRETAKNSKIPQQDRQIAEARYRQFRAAAKKRPARRRR